MTYGLAGVEVGVRGQHRVLPPPHLLPSATTGELFPKNKRGNEGGEDGIQSQETYREAVYSFVHLYKKHLLSQFLVVCSRPFAMTVGLLVSPTVDHEPYDHYGGHSEAKTDQHEPIELGLLQAWARWQVVRWSGDQVVRKSGDQVGVVR